MRVQVELTGPLRAGSLCLWHLGKKPVKQSSLSSPPVFTLEPLVLVTKETVTAEARLMTAVFKSQADQRTPDDFSTERLDVDSGQSGPATAHGRFCHTVLGGRLTLGL